MAKKIVTLLGPLVLANSLRSCQSRFVMILIYDISILLVNIIYTYYFCIVFNNYTTQTTKN